MVTDLEPYTEAAMRPTKRVSNSPLGLVVAAGGAELFHQLAKLDVEPAASLA
jgi:hypothetical protein